MFITFEGGEGSGKTTLISSIKDYLEKKNLKICLTREPGGTKLAEDIRIVVLKPRNELVYPKAELCLYLASRAQHIKQIILPALKENKIVLCDRFNDSSVVYQGHARGLGIDMVLDFSSFILEGLVPNLTFYLDIDPKIGLSRVKRSLDRIEQEDISFHQKIREGFHILEKKFPQRIKMLNAAKSKEDVFEQALKYIDLLF
ncbi:MAG: dTMP kinase [Parachlamydiales bacterium]|nr:dTMP kinase [Parachlamydiales bacterium]